MMNHCAVMPLKNGCREDVAWGSVVCPEPRRSKVRTDILDIILSKNGCGLDSEHVYSLLPGSPPSRVSNPLIKDARFIEVKQETCLSPCATQHHPRFQIINSSSSSSSRKGGLVRSNFGNTPTVRVEGFEALERDGRNCSVSAFA